MLLGRQRLVSCCHIPSWGKQQHLAHNGTQGLLPGGIWAPGAMFPGLLCLGVMGTRDGATALQSWAAICCQHRQLLPLASPRLYRTHIMRILNTTSHTCAIMMTPNHLRTMAENPLDHLFSWRKSQSCSYRPQAGFSSLESWWISVIPYKNGQLGAQKTWSCSCFTCYQAEHRHASLINRMSSTTKVSKHEHSFWHYFRDVQHPFSSCTKKLYVGLKLNLSFTHLQQQI